MYSKALIMRSEASLRPQSSRSRAISPEPVPPPKTMMPFKDFRVLFSYEYLFSKDLTRNSGIGLYKKINHKTQNGNSSL